MTERWSRSDLLRQAAESGFEAGTLEKAFLLLAVLEGIAGHPYLSSRLALKGGTALNLFLRDLPRLSVDIDLNYIGTPDRERMLSERPHIERGLSAVFERLRLKVMRVPAEHAGGKWRLRQTATHGQSTNLEVDINFILRSPLWEPIRRDSHRIGAMQARNILVVETHELAAGKLCALLDRSAGRDLYDARLLLPMEDIEVSRLRLAFVLYGGINRKDWRCVSTDDIRADPREIEHMLLPVLRSSARPKREDIQAWCNQLVEDCRQMLGAILPLHAHELEFLARLNGHGEISPELLTEDAQLQERIRTHPGLLWKAKHASQHRGRSK